MNDDSDTLEGQQPQYHLCDDHMLPEEELDQSDDTPQSQDDRMLLDNDFDAQQDNLATFSALEHEIPQYLPEKALLTCSSSLLRADGKQDTYLTIHNAPSNNYVAQKINDGNEFAVGGDPSHILTSLDREFKFQPQQRWHVIVISEDTLQFVGVPRRSYPLISGMGDQSSQSAGEGIELQQERDSGGDSMMEDGSVRPISQNKLNEQGFALNGVDGAQQSNNLTNGEPATDLYHVLDNFHCTSHGQFQQIDPIDKMILDETNEPITHPSDHQQTQSPPAYDVPQPSVMPHYKSPVQDYLSQPVALPEHNKRKQPHQQPIHQTEEEQKQKIGDALFMAEDHRFGNYTGTNLCRWCGRRGHEAVQCIKWDPEHFDKLVCVVCNNKKHLLDDCLRFQVMSEEEKVKLLLVDGANRPGARSFFWPWVCTFTMPFHSLSMFYQIKIAPGKRTILTCSLYHRPILLTKSMPIPRQPPHFQCHEPSSSVSRAPSVVGTCGAICGRPSHMELVKCRQHFMTKSLFSKDLTSALMLIGP